jgi:uncharacterized protein YndB with AHSA1/START domain
MSRLGREPPVPAVEMTRVLPFERDRVFRAWIDPRIVAIWFGPRDMQVLDVTLDARVGGQYRFVMGPASWICGAYKEVSPPGTLIFTWSHVQRLDDGAERRSVESLVTVRFKDLGAATEIHLVHENLSGEAARAGVTHGWTGSFEKLSEYLRSQTGHAGP